MEIYFTVAMVDGKAVLVPTADLPWTAQEGDTYRGTYHAPYLKLIIEPMPPEPPPPPPPGGQGVPPTGIARKKETP